ncbi:MAG: Gfo/Idh/MocA family oxidoreductase [Planctomycetes bacterium]|nr:Gfo/Idh/MocA family oxidoreductase [Planctomycetota bacterium]
MTTTSHRIGIVGAGAIANSHVEGMRAAGCTVVAVADPSEAARKKMAEAQKLTAYASLAEMRAAEKLDAVSVCAPNSLHAPLAIEALKAGLSVLCEKPPSTSLGGAVDMRAAARASGKLLMMGFNQRFEPHAQQLSRMRERGLFGDIYHAKAAWIRRRGIPGMGGWFTTKALAGGGPVYDIGIHILDRTWFIMGRPKPVSVSAMAYAKFGDIEKYVCEGMWAGPRRKGGTCDTEDFAAAFIRFDNGASMQFEVSWAANRPDENGRTLVMGDKAGASWEGDTVQIYGEADNAITTSSMVYDKTIYDNRFQHFAKCLRGEATCWCTADDGVSVQAMLDAIYHSSEQRREVQVTIPA